MNYANTNSNLYEITSSEVFSSKKAIYALWYNNDQYSFHSIGKDENEYWQIHFKTLKIIPTSYKIKSANAKAYEAHPKSWILKASKDGQIWDEIGSEEGDTNLNGPLKTHEYSIKKQVEKWYSYFKLVHIESWNVNCKLRLAMCEFEILGKVQTNIQTFINKNIKLNFSLFQILILK